MHKMLIAVGAAAAALSSAPAWSDDAASAPVAASAPAAAASSACSACPEMVSIRGGEFMMGTPASDSERDDDELPQRPVRLKPFALGKTEVTVAQWREFVRASGYQTQAERNYLAQGCFTWELADADWAWREGRSWREPGWRQKDSEPVVCISWVDAQTYVRWLDQNSGVKGWRLPSEAEWEYAARAGTTTRRPWGDDDNSCEYANGTDKTIGPKGRTWSQPHPCRDGYFFTAPVGHYRPNAWGLHDMLGNAWEWVQDCYLPYAGAPSDGSAQDANDCKGRVVRGGAWDDPRGCCARPSVSGWGRRAATTTSGCGWRGRCRPRSGLIRPSVQKPFCESPAVGEEGDFRGAMGRHEGAHSFGCTFEECIARLLRVSFGAASNPDEAAHHAKGFAYAIRWDDTSTSDDRRLGIAGSALALLDLKSGELIGRRTGYTLASRTADAGTRATCPTSASVAPPGSADRDFLLTLLR